MSRRLLAIMFTDIVGYTSMMEADEQTAMNLLRTNRNLHQSAMDEHNGTWVKELGDGVLARFDSAVDAVMCAKEIQKQVQDYQLRIGIHLGDVHIENGDIFGEGVNIASRLQTEAVPGSIYISGSVYRAIKSISEIKTSSLGELHLKHVSEPIHAHAIVGDSLPVPQSRIEVPAPTMPGITSIAVLPFKSLSDDPAQQFIVDGMQDALISELAQISSLRVISRTSTMRYRDTAKTVPEIAGELGIESLVEATILKIEETAHIQVQLIQAFPEEDHLWAGSYNKEIKDVYALYSEVVQDVTTNLKRSLTREEEEHLKHPRQVDPDAYKAYLRGLHFWERLTPHGLDAAHKQFDLAIQIDPDFSSAYSGIAGVWIGRMAMGLVSTVEAGPKVYGNITKTTAIDDQNADAYYWSALLSVWIEWDWERGRAGFEKVLKLNHSHALALAYYSHLLMVIGEVSLSDEKMQLARELDMFNPLILSLYAMQLNCTRRFDEAISVVDEIMAETNNHPVALSALRTIYHNKGMFNEAYDMFKLSYASKGDKAAVAALEEGYRAGGYSRSLERVAELLVERSADRYVTDWQIATLYTRAGLGEKAIPYLKRACDMHDPNVVYLPVDPIFDTLRDDQEYIKIVDRMKLN